MNLEENERKIYVLDDDRIDHYWKEIEALLHKVPLFWDLYTPEWVYHAAKMGDLQIWALSDNAIKGIVITQIRVFPKTNVLHILAAAGVDMLKYFEEMEGMFDWVGREHGCSFIQTTVRPGLARKLRSRSTSVASLVIRKLSNQRMN